MLSMMTRRVASLGLGAAACVVLPACEETASNEATAPAGPPAPYYKDFPPIEVPKFPGVLWHLRTSYREGRVYYVVEASPVSEELPSYQESQRVRQKASWGSGSDMVWKVYDERGVSG